MPAEDGQPADPAQPARSPITPQLRDSGVVAILRAARPDRLQEVALALIESGIKCLELTLTTPGAVDAFRRLRPAVGADVALGAFAVTVPGDWEGLPHRESLELVGSSEPVIR